MRLLYSLLVLLATVPREAMAGKEKCNPPGDPPEPEVPLTTKPVSQVRTIVGSCHVDVKTCPISACRYDSRLKKKCPLDGVWCPETENRDFKCGILGTFNVSFVTSCKCCKDPGIKIEGDVVDSEERVPLSRVQLRINKWIRVETDSKARFSTTVPSGTTRVVIQAEVRKGNYIATTKVLQIPSGFKGPISVTVVVVKMADPVAFDSENDNKIRLGSEQSNQAVVIIRGGSYRTKKGNYTGKVMISTNYIDTSNRDVEDVIPGQFVTGGRRNTDPLITDGMFALAIRGERGQSLIADQVVVKVRPNMRLWTLSKDGIWLPLSDNERKKRQIGLTTEFLINIDSAAWVNIDRIPGAARCYFKARVFDELTDTEITVSPAATFKPEAVGYTSLNQRLRFYLPSTNTPADTCYEVRCPDISDPDDTLLGMVNMNSYESISIGGITFPHVTQLTPRELYDYSDAIIPRLGVVHYQVVPDDKMYVNFISNTLGPFYTNQKACEASTIDNAALHFLKPELPSYVPFPDDIQLCTARIGFLDGCNFFEALDTLAAAPTVSALSTWEVNGTVYFYTATSTMGCSSNEDEFLYVCIKYRCSSEDAITTVRVDMDVPYTSVNDSDVETPAFVCQPSECVTDDCKQRGKVTIDGSFEAPIDIGDGPDVFMDAPNDCADRSAIEPFALKFTCYS